MLPRRAHFYRPLWDSQGFSMRPPFTSDAPGLPLHDARFSRTAHALVVEIPMPGYQNEDIEVTCDGRTLAITAQRRGAHTTLSGTGLRHANLMVRSFRRIVLPEAVDGWRVSSCADGRLLTIHVPVSTTPHPGVAAASRFLKRTWDGIREGARRAWSTLTRR